MEHGQVTWQAGTQRSNSNPGITTAPPEDRAQGARAYWLSPPGLVTLAATVVALAIRLYLLTRLRYLTGITEYDDGVYLGGAVSLISGTVPYHGFAFVQPPGILLLMVPVALLAKVSAITSAMAAARLLTVGASAACVALLGSLVRHRGAFVTLVACGMLAVYPDDIMAAHTLLLEPWIELKPRKPGFYACLAFREGRPGTAAAAAVGRGAVRARRGGQVLGGASGPWPARAVPAHRARGRAWPQGQRARLLSGGTGQSWFARPARWPGSRFPSCCSPRRGRACSSAPPCLTRSQGPVRLCRSRCGSRTSPGSPTC